MIARFDHRPMLTAALALTTTLLFVVVVTLSTLLITAPPAPTPSSESDGANPGAAAAPAIMDAGGKSYGYDIYRASRGDSQKRDSAECQEVGHP